jgi:cyanophycin synthetase
MFAAARERFYHNFWFEAAESVGAEIRDLGQGFLQIQKGGRSTLVRLHHVNIDTYLNLMIVDNKPLIHKLLRDCDYRVPRFVEYELHKLAKAREFMDEIEGCCVVKPSAGSGGTGITTGINSRKRLRQASLAATSTYYRQKPIIEEEVEGDSYRLLFLDGELIDAVRRGRPTVVGDGAATLRELIHAENRERLGSGPSRSFTCLSIDLDCKFRLEDNDMTLKSVPAPGETIIVKNVANQNSVRDNHSVRDKVHPSYQELGRRITSLLGVKLIGADIMCEDITVSLNESGGAINELNIPPGLHYHELIENQGSAARVATQILEYLFADPVMHLTVPKSLPAKALSQVE